MKRVSSLWRDERGATVIEIAFVLPALLVMVWMMIQLGFVFRASSGIQHALGQGARLATIWPRPTDAAIKARMQSAVYGIEPGTFTVFDPAPGAGFLDLKVTYTQPTSMLLFPGPTVNMTRTKRVWVAN